MEYSVHCVFFFNEKHYYMRKRKQTLNCPRHVIGGGYVVTSPPAIGCFALASRASPIKMAWGYAVKGIICLVHYRKGKNYTQNRSYTHIPPLNTRKDFWFKAKNSFNTKALLHYKAKNEQVPLFSHRAGGRGQSKDRIYTNTALQRCLAERNSTKQPRNFFRRKRRREA